MIRKTDLRTKVPNSLLGTVGEQGLEGEGYLMVMLLTITVGKTGLEQ